MMSETGTTAPAPLPEAQQLIEKIDKLQEMLRTSTPGYERLLHDIHVTLHKNADTVHMLSDEQIGIIVSGLARRKNVVISEIENKTKSKKSAKGGSLKAISLDDL